MGFKNWIFISLIYGCSIFLFIDGLSITNDRESRKLFGGYKITPKFCNASRILPPNDPRAHGPTICMFNHECTQRHGEVVGACMDGFLFGTCCQLHGSVETPLRPNTFKYSTTSKPAAAILYEQYGEQQQASNSNSGIGEVGGYYGNQNDDDLNETNPSYGAVYDDSPPYNDNDSDLSIEQFSSPSSNIGQKHDVFSSTPKPTIFIPDNYDNLSSYFPISTTPSTPITKGEMYLPPSENSQQTFSVEIPSLLSQYGNDGQDFVESDNKVSTEPPIQHDFTAAGISHITNILTNDNLFSHSDITHPGPDSILVETNEQDPSHYGFIPPSSTASHLLPTSEKSDDVTDETTTPRVVKITYPKPQFKPKPTKSTEKPNQYILVHTISNDKHPTEIPAKPEATISENDIESIETIILQLNGTQQGGPQYETLTEKTGDRPSSTYLYNSVTPSYGSTSFYVTNKLPGSELIAGGSSAYYPSTNYAVPSPTPTRPSVIIDNIDRFTNKLPGSDLIAGGSSEYYSSTNYVPSTTTPTRRPVTTPVNDDRFTLISSTTNSIKLPSSTLQPPSDNTVTGRPTVLISTSTLGDSNSNKPSTSYIFSPTPITRKPTTTKTTLTTLSDEVVITPTTKKPTKKPGTKRPSRPTTTKTTTKTQTTNKVKISTSRPPSTSYVSSTSVQPPKTPTQIILDSTTEKPSTVILIGNYGNDFVSSTPIPTDENQSNGGFVQISTITDRPHNPTVHITPKPTVNLITQTSTWSNRPTMNQYTVTGQPDTASSYIYQRPGIHYSTSPNYPPISNDFDDPGYFGVTMRPAIEHSVSTTAIYHNVVSQDPILNSYGQPISGSTTYYRPVYGSTYGEPVYQSTPSYPAFSGQNELYHSTSSYPIYNGHDPDAQQSSPSDLNDFPPDRNPNIPIRNPTPVITTPSFTEDNVLDEKMNILVNKIVASMQDNFEGLADLLYERNDTMIEIENLPDRTTAAPVKPSVITKKPVAASTTGGSSAASKPTGTKKPVTKKPATAKPLSDSAASSPTGTKRPTTATPLKPVNSQTPTKKPVTKITTKAPTTTKKPTKLQTSSTTVVAGSVTTKKPVRVGTSTKRPTTKPTKRSTTTKPTSTTEAVEYEESGEEDVGQQLDNQEENSSDASSRILCGVRPQMKTGRIVGGKSSQFGEWPWQVLVRESTWLGLFTKNKCGGVLISNNYVITAAHCQPGFLASLVAVFGEYDISGELESKRSVTKNVKNVIVHRNYDAATFENDLALLELESPVYYDSHIVPICMPSDNADFTGRTATVSGWGRLKYGGGVPSVLQVVQVPIIENNVCQEMFNTAGHNKKILPSFLCAGYATGQKDSCEGDSGGPLVLQRPDGRWELAGTVSHGIKCAAPYLPGVYMRTTFYKPWFESVTGVH